MYYDGGIYDDDLYTAKELFNMSCRIKFHATLLSLKVNLLSLAHNRKAPQN